MYTEYGVPAWDIQQRVASMPVGFPAHNALACSSARALSYLNYGVLRTFRRIYLNVLSVERSFPHTNYYSALGTSNTPLVAVVLRN